MGRRRRRRSRGNATAVIKIKYASATGHLPQNICHTGHIPDPGSKRYNTNGTRFFVERVCTHRRGASSHLCPSYPPITHLFPSTCLSKSIRWPPRKENQLLLALKYIHGFQMARCAGVLDCPPPARALLPLSLLSNRHHSPHSCLG